MKTKTIAKLKSDLWVIFSRFTRLRDAIKTTDDSEFVICVTCGKWKPVKQVDAGHFISKTKTFLYFDEKNVHAQCKQCNMPPDPGEQHLYGLAIVKMYGQKTLDRLQREKNNEKRFTKKELKELIKTYKEKLQKLTEAYGNPWA